MNVRSDLVLAYHMGYDDASAKRMPDATKARVLNSYICTNSERTETCREVYLLMATDIGDGREEVLGVYATEEAATAAINENQFGYALHYVRKWEVDA